MRINGIVIAPFAMAAGATFVAYTLIARPRAERRRRAEEFSAVADAEAESHSARIAWLMKIRPGQHETARHESGQHESTRKARAGRVTRLHRAAAAAVAIETTLAAAWRVSRAVSAYRRAAREV